MKDNPDELMTISHDTCKKLVEKGVPSKETYCVVLTPDKTGMDRDMPFFVRWNYLKGRYEAQLAVLTESGKYGRMVVDQTLYDHIERVVKRILAITKLFGVISESMYAESSADEMQELFPGLKGE